MTDSNVAWLVRQSAEATPEHPAFLVLGEEGEVRRVITFAHLETLVAAVAGGLRARGVARGHRVVVFVPMQVELYVTMLAVLRLGAVATFIEPWGGRRMVDHAAKLVEADAFVGIPKSLLLRAMSPALRRTRVTVSTGARRVPGTARFADLERTLPQEWATDIEPTTADDPALVTFTTGSTGTPKGANRTHEILLAQHHSLARHVPDAAGTIVWTNLPVVVLHNLGRGVTTVLPPATITQDASPDPVRLHGLLAQSHATVLAMSPGPLTQLAAASHLGPIEAVQRVYTGGGPVTPALLESVQRVLPGATITALYGSTEAEPIAHASADAVLAQREAMRSHGGIYIGREVDDVQLRIVPSDDGAAAGANAGGGDDAGEVLVAGAHVNRSYWRNEAAVRAHKVVDAQGVTWHRTGDVARRDDDGGLWLLGRVGQALQLSGGGGRRVWALEIETPVADAPEIARAALCVPHAVLAVEPAAGCTVDDAERAAHGRLTALGLEGEVRVVVLDRIPVDKRHATKIDVEQLRRVLKLPPP